MVMRTRPLLARRLNLALLAGTAVILLEDVPAKAATSIITCTYAITATGSYEVDQNLSCPGEDGIDIQVSHVHLNLNGHIITGDGTHNGILVEPASGPTGALTDIHIVGPGLVQKFGEGISLNAALADSEVRNVTSASNGDGIVAELTGSLSGLHLTENVAVSNAGQGILLWHSTDGQLQNNDATFNGSDGFFLVAGSGNDLHANRAEGNGAYGILIDGGSTNNDIDGNATNGNDLYGIVVNGGSTGEDIRNNHSTGNGVVDMLDGNTSPPCDSNNWHNNTFFTSNLSCIH